MFGQENTIEHIKSDYSRLLIKREVGLIANRFIRSSVVAALMERCGSKKKKGGGYQRKAANWDFLLWRLAFLVFSSSQRAPQVARSSLGHRHLAHVISNNSAFFFFFFGNTQTHLHTSVDKKKICCEECASGRFSKGTWAKTSAPSLIYSCSLANGEKK